MAGYGITKDSGKNCAKFSEIWEQLKWNTTTVLWSNVQEYNNISAEFHIRFLKEKEIYETTEKEDLLELLNMRMFKYYECKIKFTKNELDTLKISISSTVMNSVLDIIVGNKLLKLDKEFSQVSVCLLWLLNDTVIKERIQYEKEILKNRLMQLNKALESL